MKHAVGGTPEAAVHATVTPGRALAVLFSVASVTAVATLGKTALNPGPPGTLARSSSGRPVRWVPFEIALQPVESNRDPAATEALLQALASGVETWNDALGGCGAPKLRALAATVASPGIRRDGVSVVLLRERGWCPDPPRDPEDCYDSERAGITHLYPSDPDAPYSEVREADVEINAVDFAWSVDGSAAGTRSLQALVNHELGHVLGIDHPCGRDPGIPGTVPHPGGACTPAHEGALMYPAPVEAGRAPVLEPTHAEIETLCALYSSGRP